LKAGLAVVAEDKVRHGLISTIDLYLNEACLIAATVLTWEQALVVITLGLDFLGVPVCPLVVHVGADRIFSLLLDFVAS